MNIYSHVLFLQRTDGCTQTVGAISREVVSVSEAKLWSRFQKKSCLSMMLSKLPARLTVEGKKRRGPGSPSFGGGHIKCWRASRRAWGNHFSTRYRNAFSPPTENSAAFIFRPTVWITSEHTDPLSVCVCTCLLKVNWSIARKEGRLTAISVQLCCPICCLIGIYKDPRQRLWIHYTHTKHLYIDVETRKKSIVHCHKY